MGAQSKIELMRLIHGELHEEAARKLQEQLGEDPELRGSFEQLARLWHDLELPEPAAAPPGFAARVVVTARESTRDGWVPVWWSRTLIGRVASAAVLAGGIAVGAMLGPVTGSATWSEFTTTEPSLAESYLVAMRDTETDQWLEGEQ